MALIAASFRSAKDEHDQWQLCEDRYARFGVVLVPWSI
ncbi:hypothetical protein SAMN05216553_101642 [Lentzea fradiae]|uniref:Uncharacterized protein n=1 Tax=Lentzea fradiae TaxID=200378 RepID=A0A1G7L3F8_9PSEU|nr:hypothetical protein SAMN05216553_101642 [Lentzea fradiae]